MMRVQLSYGATGTTAMTHIAIVEQLEGNTVDWLEKVKDEEYVAANAALRRAS